MFLKFNLSCSTWEKLILDRVARHLQRQRQRLCSVPKWSGCFYPTPLSPVVCSLFSAFGLLEVEPDLRF